MTVTGTFSSAFDLDGSCLTFLPNDQVSWTIIFVFFFSVLSSFFEFHGLSVSATLAVFSQQWNSLFITSSRKSFILRCPWTWKYIVTCLCLKFATDWMSIYFLRGNFAGVSVIGWYSGPTWLTTLKDIKPFNNPLFWYNHYLLIGVQCDQCSKG